MQQTNYNRIIIKEQDSFFSLDVKRAIQGLETDQVEEDLTISTLCGTLVNLERSDSGKYMGEYLIPYYTKEIKYEGSIYSFSDISTNRSEFSTALKQIGMKGAMGRDFAFNSRQYKARLYFEDLSAYITFLPADNGKFDLNITGGSDYGNIKKWIALRTKGLGHANESLCLPNLYTDSNVCWGSPDRRLRYNSLREIVDSVDYFFSGIFNTDLNSKAFDRELIEYNENVIRQYMRSCDDTTLLEAIETVLDTFRTLFEGYGLRASEGANKRSLTTYYYILICDALKIPINKLRANPQ